MKKLISFLGISLVIVVLIILIAGFMQPKDLSIERSVSINASHNVVFNQIKFFKNWTNWSPMVDKEPNIKISYLGLDGQFGSSFQWKSDDLGEGEVSNTGIFNNRLDYNVQFISPWESNADGSFITEDLGNNNSKVTWKMVKHGTFPFNAFNYFIEKIIGKDFENGLSLLKKYAESNQTIALSVHDIVEKEFPATQLATIRKKIPFSEMQAFSSEAFQKLAKLNQNKILGAASTIYYDWDDQNQMTDMAPAFPVSAASNSPEIIMVHIPATKSCQLAVKGSYAGLGRAHEIMGQYIAEKGIQLSYVIEQYQLGPANEADSNKWLTNVVYLIK
jgi:effector-binding domain-containing protein